MKAPADLPHRIVHRIDAALAAGSVPRIILDLDGTLLDNIPRTKVILQESVRRLLGSDHPLERRIAELPEAEFEYAPVDTLRKQGLEDEDTLVALREEWASRFFGGRYLAHDRPRPGAVAAARGWWERGAALHYLTGRHAPEMVDGTRDSLRNAGFPLGERATLQLKPDLELEDVAFKAEAAPSIGREGPLVLVVDNDPRVINALAGAVPEAIAVLVSSPHPKDSPAPRETVIPVRGFRDLA